MAKKATRKKTKAKSAKSKSPKRAVRKVASKKSSSSKFPAVAFIGVGNMAEEMVNACVNSGWPRDRLFLTHRRPERRAELQKRFKVKVGDDNLAAVRNSDCVVLAVRPQEFPGLLETLQPAFRPGQTLISIAAGLLVEWLQKRLPKGMKAIRVTPPPTAWVSAGVTLLSCDPDANPAHRRVAERLVKGTCDRIEWIPDSIMEPLVAISLAITPYTCYWLETLIKTGIEQGIDPDHARRAVMEGNWATALLLKNSGFSPDTIISKVATREGLTYASLHTMEAHDVHGGIRAGARSMTARSFEFRGETVPPDYKGFSR
ncbi:MAG: hypothetical protein EXQ90_08395 [Rhodospirillales bacterium]|nr:hypothetical protein [Rhodospirillales bacterium]